MKTQFKLGYWEIISCLKRKLVKKERGRTQKALTAWNRVVGFFFAMLGFCYPSKLYFYIKYHFSYQAVFQGKDNIF